LTGRRWLKNPVHAAIALATDNSPSNLSIVVVCSGYCLLPGSGCLRVLLDNFKSLFNYTVTLRVLYTVLPRQISLIALLLALSVVIAAAGYVAYYYVLNIRGVVNVPGEVKTIDINLEIEKPEGEVRATYGFTAGANYCVRFYVQDVEFEGNFSIIISGLARLENLDTGVTYNISMPCLIANKACIRILALIPGYDTPLQILPGKYNATVVLKWAASGTGSFSAKLYMELSPCK